MWKSRNRFVLVATFLLGLVSPGAWGQPAPSIQSMDDFNKVLRTAINFYNSVPGAGPELARRALEPALEWARANPGVENVQLVGVLFLMGKVANMKHDDAWAEALFNETLGLVDASSSPDQWFTYQILRRILAIRWRDGKAGDAVAIARRMAPLSRTQLKQDILAAMSTTGPATFEFGQDAAPEPYERAFGPVRDDLNRIVATLLPDPGAGPELGEAVIALKAIVQDAAAGLHVLLAAQETQAPRGTDALASYFGTAAVNPLGQELAPLDRLRANAAAMSLLGYADMHITADRLPRPLQLQHERVDLERFFTRTFHPDWQPETLDDIQQALPSDAVILEYMIYATPPTKLQPTGSAHYLLLLISSQGVETVEDLGEVANINAQLARSCQAILHDVEESSHCSEQSLVPLEPSATVKTVGQQLYHALFGNAAATIEHADQIIVSPDGALNFFPFETLVDRKGDYLVRNHVLSYVQSAREVVAWKHSIPSRSPPLILADPNYSAPTPQGDCGDGTRGAHRRLRATDSLTDFQRLCGTADEAKIVKERLPDAKVLTGGDATEEAVKKAFGPRILHIATHGFADAELKWPSGFFSQQNQAWWSRQDYEVLDADLMLRGGLVFAGANNRQSPGGHDDGLLSAAEASLLNLNGTQLVVLSACDSGLGLARAGDGIFGLRRALILAGARAQTFSLWPVSDSTTGEFMRRYYALLNEGRPNAEALALVKRELLAEGGILSEPWNWAVFVGYGHPGPLAR